MSFPNGLYINSDTLIEEVRKRPALYDYSSKPPKDRIEKLELWKQVGSAIFEDWGSLKKSVAYDRVIQLQKKWRSIRDAYMRELRWRKSGTKTSKRVYIYFKKLTFLGGMDEKTEALMESLNNNSESNNSDEESPAQQKEDVETDSWERPPRPNKIKRKSQRPKPRKIRAKMEEVSDYDDDDHHTHQTEEVEMPVYMDTDDSDTDKLFLMSFLPEMRKLQPNIKMWMRAQIASIMQEAVTCQYNNTQPGASGYEGSSVNDVKNALSSSD